MRYMIMHKTNASWEAGEKPTPELGRRVGAMVGELQRAGVLLAGEGLGPSAEGARVRAARDGTVRVEAGPFGPEGALPARYMIFRAATVERAAEIGARLARIFGEVVVDVRPVNEPWDVGFAPRPEGLTSRRYMAVVNANAQSETATPLEPAQHAALRALEEELREASVFLALEHFEPSNRGKRIRMPAKGDPKRKRVVLDGPFTETKELIGGFVILEVPAIDDAVGWAMTYADAVDVEEIDVRGLVGTERQ